MEQDWDYTTDYCDGCAELGLTSCSCSCEPTCGNCGADMTFNDNDICDDCQAEEDEFLKDED